MTAIAGVTLPFGLTPWADIAAPDSGGAGTQGAPARVPA